MRSERLTRGTGPIFSVIGKKILQSCHYAGQSQQVGLTSLGCLVRPQLEEIAARAKGVELAVRQFLTLENAPLRLDALCTIGPAIITKFLKEFSNRNPAVEITLRDGTPKGLIQLQLLLDDEIDFAIMAQPYEYDERLRVQQLYNEPFAVAFGLRHPFENLTAVTLTDMDKQIYLRRLIANTENFFANLLRERGLALRSHIKPSEKTGFNRWSLGVLACVFFPNSRHVSAGCEHGH